MSTAADSKKLFKITISGRIYWAYAYSYGQAFYSVLYRQKSVANIAMPFFFVYNESDGGKYE